MKKRTYFYLFAFLFTCLVCSTSFAQEASTVSINVSKEVIEKKMPYYYKSIKQLQQKAENQLEKVDSELKDPQNIPQAGKAK